MLETAPGQAVRCPHAAILSPVPHAPMRHPLETLSQHAAVALAGCSFTLIAGYHAPAMLMVEYSVNGGPDPAATWLVTVASPSTMRLEALVDEARLDLLAEGPPNRILATLAGLGREAARGMEIAVAIAGHDASLVEH